MTTLQTRMHLRGRERRQLAVRVTRQTNQVLAQREALERLISLLEKTTPDAMAHRVRTVRNGADNSGQLARLRAARTSYALATNNEMERVGAGAWVRRRRS